MTITPAKNISSYIIQSQEEEIKRIAFELHEGVGQTLYSLYTGLQFLESGVEQPAAKSYLRDMALVLEKTIQEVRLLSVELHPPTLTTLGLLPAIKSYIKLYTSTFGIEVKLENTGVEKPIAEHNSIALFRVCQEALGNIAKYADTSNATLSFIWEPDLLKIEISDAGKGFDVEKAMNQSSGLAAMNERMILAGGKCHISSTVGKGTMIRISLPLT
ncbi:two-component sensor histidine kinase [Bacillus sp. V3-13]|uniref:sensor histidine kinase n=1 Tax=Bacillus sp. V3-13 TaxID=2053728 RepID=UPI000C76FD88|nr:sensor histidine kinase [Bacillus sp. V3-13]PLR76858.1 two-component sensor histidine kinase [Bacillus sp. V3-13]